MDVSSVEEARVWTPFLTNPLDWEDFLANKDLYPRSFPLTKEGFYLHHAFCRYQLMKQSPFLEDDIKGAEEGKRRAGRGGLEERRKKLILTPQFWEKTLNPGLALLLALDVYQPEGLLDVYQIKGDKVQEKLGTVISLTAVNRRKEVLGKVALSLGKSQTLELKPEEIVFLQVDRNTALEMDFRLAAAQVLGKKKARVSASGGELGVIIDARGRPIEIEEGEAGWKKIKRWMKVFF